METIMAKIKQEAINFNIQLCQFYKQVLAFSDCRDSHTENKNDDFRNEQSSTGEDIQVEIFEVSCHANSLKEYEIDCRDMLNLIASFGAFGLSQVVH